MFELHLSEGGAGISLEVDLVEGRAHLKGEDLVHEPAGAGLGKEVDDLERLGPVEGEVEGTVFDLVTVFVCVDLKGGLRKGDEFVLRVLHPLAKERVVSDF